MKRIHFTDTYLMNPSHPVTVNLIGGGGTGSQVLTCLARLDVTLRALGHPGLSASVRPRYRGGDQYRETAFLRIRNRTQQSPLSHIARQQLFRKRLGSRTSMVSGKNESNGKDGHGKHIHYMHR